MFWQFWRWTWYGQLLLVGGIASVTLITVQIWRSQAGAPTVTRQQEEPKSERYALAPQRKPMADTTVPPAPGPTAPVTAPPRIESTVAARRLATLPITVEELARGRAWRIRISSHVDLQDVVEHVQRDGSPIVIRLQGEKTYRFSAPFVPRGGPVHLMSRYPRDTGRRVRDAIIPPLEVKYGHAVLPPVDTLVAVWMENPHVPFEMVLEETPETQSEADSQLAYLQKSQLVP